MYLPWGWCICTGWTQRSRRRRAAWGSQPQGTGWHGSRLAHEYLTRKKEAKISYFYLFLPYSRKYWWELNLAVEPKIAIARILADLNSTVRYGIAIHIYMYARRKFWWILIWRLWCRPPNRQIIWLYGISLPSLSFFRSPSLLMSSLFSLSSLTAFCEAWVISNRHTTNMVSLAGSTRWRTLEEYQTYHNSLPSIH